MGDARETHLLICNTADGFVAQVNGVVIQLQLARRLGLTPIVYLHGRSYMFGAPNPYFDAAMGPNVWDYFFEPIGPSGDALKALVAEGRVVTLTTASELFRLFRWEPRSWFMNPFGWFRSVENTADGPYPALWWEEQRNRARVFLDDGTVRVNAAMQAQVDRFVDHHFTPHTLGVQMRGSDKFDFGSGPNLGRKVMPEEYFPLIDAYLESAPEGTKIFMATDQRQWLKIVQEAYPGKVLSFAEASLSDDDQNRIFSEGNNAVRGVEVLVDLMLLSRCARLIKCHAAVGEMAATLNADLPVTDMNYERQSHEARPTAARAVLAPAIRALGGLWAKMAEGGMALTRVVAVKGDRVVVDPANPRDLNVKETRDDPAKRSPVVSKRFVADGLDRVLTLMAAGCWRYEEKE